jgi:hypothetical protein
MVTKVPMAARPATEGGANAVLGELVLDVCPNCGSPRVRWRKRRFYDVVLTWLAAGLLSAGAYGDYDETHSWALYNDLDPPIQDPSITWTTPRRFWNCPDCCERGDEY